MPFRQLAALSLLSCANCVLHAEDARTLGELRTEGNAALRAGEAERLVNVCERIATLFPDQAEAATVRGDLLLRAGFPEKSLEAWNEVVQLRPAAEPYLWQRGIAQYYAGEHQAGRKQFELHRRVNPNDVENAVWHFLCVAAEEGVEAARQAYLPAPGDPREPMEEIYSLFAGRASKADVLAAVEGLDVESDRGKNARFYAHLYLALHADALGQQREAQQEIDRAVALGLTHYMADVARLHQQHLQDKMGASSDER